MKKLNAPKEGYSSGFIHRFNIQQFAETAALNTKKREYGR